MSDDLRFDLSRDLLDGVVLSQPAPSNGEGEVQIGGGIQFLPSSPDGTMHTAIVGFSLQVKGQQQPFARAGWRFLFTTNQKYDPRTTDHPFHRSLLALGAGKLLTVLNNLHLHANLPLIPVDPQRMVQAASNQAGQAPAQG